MKILLDMIHLLNREHEDVALIEKLKKFNYKLNKNSDDNEKVLLLLETLYCDITELNKQYPYLKDILLSIIDVFDRITKDNKRSGKNEISLKNIIHKLRNENEMLRNDKLICDTKNRNQQIINPLVDCNIIINGFYTII